MAKSSGCTTSQTVPTDSEHTPVKMNASGKLTDGAFAPNGAVLGTVFGTNGLTAADMGKEATIGLFFGFGSEPALCKLGV